MRFNKIMLQLWIWSVLTIFAIILRTTIIIFILYWCVEWLIFHKSLRDVLFSTILFIWIFVTSGQSPQDSYYVDVIVYKLIIKICDKTSMCLQRKINSVSQQRLHFDLIKSVFFECLYFIGTYLKGKIHFGLFIYTTRVT